MRVMRISPEDVQNVRGFAGFVPAQSYASDVAIMTGEIGTVNDVRFVTVDAAQPDPVLRKMQEDIKETISYRKKIGVEIDNLPLQAQCATIGHVPSIIKGINAPTCFYCDHRL